MTRTVEVYTGAYASGKSETSINRALQYVKGGKNITLVDLDTVEPAYCMRPIEKTLKAVFLSTGHSTECPVFLFQLLLLPL